MKLALSAAVSAACFTTTALASGPIAPPPAPPPVIVSSAYDWSGPYVGLGLTYGRGGMDDAVSPPDNPDSAGFGVGVLGGYNWQRGNLVFGAEVALDFAGRSGDNDCGIGGGFTCQTLENNNASIRGRVGVAQDRTLFFVEAGYATDQRTIQHSLLGVPFFSATARFNGPMIGVGFERAMGRNGDWRLRGDLEHYMFGTQTFGPYTIDGDLTLARLSWIRRF